MLFCGQTKINGIGILEELKNKIYPQIFKRLVNISLVYIFTAVPFINTITELVNMLLLKSCVRNTILKIFWHMFNNNVAILTQTEGH